MIYLDDTVIPDIDPLDGWFTLSASDALADSASWRRVIDGLPVSTQINGDTVYYAYTVEEEAVEGYATEITYSSDGYTATVRNTHRPLLPFTGGLGDALFLLIGVGSILFAITVFRRRKEPQPANGPKTFRPPRGSPRGHPRGSPRGHPRGSPRDAVRGSPRGHPRE